MTFRTDRPLYKICVVVLLLAFGLWLTQDLISPQHLFAQSSANGYLQKGKTHWENFEVEEAIVALERALQMNLPRNMDKIEAHKILAFCWATKRESQKAEAEFKKILQIDSNFTLPDNESPIFLEPFRQAKAKETPKDTDPPEIVHIPVSKIDEGKSLTITAKITDKTQIASALVFFKSKSDTKFRILNMSTIQKDTYQVQFSANTFKPPELAYYITAKDREGNSGMWRSAGNPFKVKITPAKKEETTPIIAKTSESQKKETGKKPVEKTKKKKGGIPILGILLGVVVIGGGAAALAMGSKDEESTEPTASNILVDPPPWPD